MLIDPPANPMRPISWTASETIARNLVDKLCKAPPFGMSWRAFAEREIARALAAATMRNRRDP
jgi:hypothetical protein